MRGHGLLTSGVQPGTPSTFQGFAELGYSRLVPIVPPDAEVSPRSTLFKSVNMRSDSRGKAPGLKGDDGLWRSYSWLTYEVAANDLQNWQKMGAGVGIRTGDSLIAIDVDAYSERFANKIRDIIFRRLGELPERVGQAPKALYLLRVSEPIPYMRVEFGDRDEKGRLRDRVEILSDGKQFVAAGIHRSTKMPYRWPRGLCAFDDLPVRESALVRDLMEELRSQLPQATKVVAEGSSAQAPIDQNTLRGELADIREAISLIPNSGNEFSSRDAYLNVGYAIKAALPDNPSEALELFQSWCARWTDGENDHGVVNADWARLKPPYRRGASWLYELAGRFDPTSDLTVKHWFSPITDAPDPFTPIAPAKRILDPTPFSFPEAADIPRRAWIYSDHYIRRFVSATVAPGGLGKSSLTIVEALSMASGKPLLGVEPNGEFDVWLWNGEDPQEELDRRVTAAMQEYGLTKADIGGRLFLDTGHNQPIILAKESRAGAAIDEQLSTELFDAVGRRKVDVLILDPFVSIHRVSENDNGAIDLVTKRLARLAAEKAISVELVHHVRKPNGSETTIHDARGASALANTVRAGRALTGMTESEGRSLGVEKYWNYFRFSGASKSNLAPTTSSPASKATWFTTRSVNLGNGSGTGADRLVGGDSVGVVALANLEEAMAPQSESDTVEMLKIINDGDYRENSQSADWYGRAIAKLLMLDPVNDAGDRTAVKGHCSRLIKAGMIECYVKQGTGRTGRPFVRLTSAGKSRLSGPSVGGVFD